MHERGRSVMLPWIDGRVNGALSSHPAVALTGPEAFDPRRHAEVPRAIAKAEASLRPMLTQIEQVIAALVTGVEETGLTRMGFARL